MKRVLVLSIIIFVTTLVYSCKKNDDPPAPEYHLTCFINDTLRKFNFRPIAGVSSPNGVDFSGIGIIGFSTIEGDMSSPSLDIHVQDFFTKKIEARTYTDTSKTIQVFSQYHAPELNPSDYYSGSNVYEDASSINFNLTHGLRINFTKVSKTVIQGTFSGDYYASGYHYVYDKPIRITNGSFYLQVQE